MGNSIKSPEANLFSPLQPFLTEYLMVSFVAKKKAPVVKSRLRDFCTKIRTYIFSLVSNSYITIYR
jgi:hypothetical protein